MSLELPVGETLGLPVGGNVGASVGETNGESVGVFVGENVGDVVGPFHMMGVTSAQGILDLPKFHLTTSMY